MSDDEVGDSQDGADRRGVRTRERFDAAMLWLLGFFGRTGGSILRAMPFSARLFERLANGAIHQYYKKTGADAIGLETRPGQRLELDPVKFKSAEECDEEGEKSGWYSYKRSEVWNAASMGDDVVFLNGKTPTIPLHHDDHAQAGWLRPRISEAIELGQYQPLYHDPTLQIVVDADGQQGQTVADGGYRVFEADAGEWLGDSIIDLDSGDGYTGMRVSFAKASDWAAETTTTQEMEMQEQRGFLRGIANNDQPDAFKYLLVAAAVILGVLGIVFGLPYLLGDGLGNVVPITLG